MKKRIPILLALIVLTSGCGLGPFSGKRDCAVRIKKIWQKDFHGRIKEFSCTYPVEWVFTDKAMLFLDKKGGVTRRIERDEKEIIYISSQGDYIAVNRAEKVHDDLKGPVRTFELILRNSLGSIMWTDFQEHYRNIMISSDQGILIENISREDGWCPGCIRFYSKKGEEKTVFLLGRDRESCIVNIGISGNGRYIAALAGDCDTPEDSMLVLFDSSGSELWRRALRDNLPVKLELSSGGNLILAIGRNLVSETYNFFLFDGTGKEILNGEVPRGLEYVAAFSLDEKYMAMGSSGRDLCFFSAERAAALWEHKEIPGFGEVASVDISGDGKLIAAGCREGEDGPRVFLFDRRGEIVWSKDLKSSSKKISPMVSLSADGSVLLCAAGKKLICYRIDDRSE